jgi:hypothetical protein
MSKARPEPEREELIRAYKTILQDVVDRRPSGLRLKIAEGIGRNKSFVSQITSPNYPIPIPRKHLDLIFELAHFTPEEKSKFMDCYRRAHPRIGARVHNVGSVAENHRVLRLELPRLGGAALDSQVDQLVRDFARRVIEMMKTRK